MMSSGWIPCYSTSTQSISEAWHKSAAGFECSKEKIKWSTQTEHFNVHYAVCHSKKQLEGYFFGFCGPFEKLFKSTYSFSVVSFSVKLHVNTIWNEMATADFTGSTLCILNTYLPLCIISQMYCLSDDAK